MSLRERDRKGAVAVAWRPKPCIARPQIRNKILNLKTSLCDAAWVFGGSPWSKCKVEIAFGYGIAVMLRYNVT